MFWRG